MAKFHSIIIFATLAAVVHGIPRPLCPCDYALAGGPVPAIMVLDPAGAVITSGIYPNPSYPVCPCYCQQWVCPLCVQDCGCAVIEASPTDDITSSPVPAIGCTNCPTATCNPSECTYSNVVCRSSPYPITFA